jgi:hypothetical protein
MKSIIYSVSKEILQQYINESKTYGQVLKRFDLENRGANPKTLKRRIKDEGLDDSSLSKNLKFGGGWNKNTKGILNKRMSLEDAMVKIFTKRPSSQQQKNYIRSYKLIDEICGECGLGKEWNNKPITLELDHIDGDSINNILSNLRWLCPNCHSQTDTFRGRKLRRKYFCECGKEMLKNSKTCNYCSNKNQPRKVIRPSKEELEKLVKENPMTQLGKRFGVSDNAIRKWCKSYNINW